MEATATTNMSTALYNDKDQVAKDLETIEREYVKKILFPAVKFLYNDKDLEEGGKLCSHFMTNCRTGPFKLGGGYIFTEDDTSNYLRFLWNNHVREKGLCKKWLSNRRSTVYTVMQHKFRTLCESCRELGCVLPSLSTFESRLKNPKTYYLFYVYFYRPAIGEAGWKTFVDRSRDDRQRIGNCNTEAFAHMVLKNNYFVWLYEARQKDSVRELKTEYDTKVSQTSPAAVDCLMPDIEICPEKFTIMREDSPAYQDVRKKRIKAHQDAYTRNKVHGSLRTMKKINELMDKENANPVPLSTTKREQLRRKLCRELKHFTGNGDPTAKRTKGWNSLAQCEMTKLIKDIRADVNDKLYEQFEPTFRTLYKQLSGRNDEVDLQEDKEPVEYDVLWEV